jgi:DGQHR domain-containing protein
MSMSGKQTAATRSIPALKVRQWLPLWDAVPFDSDAMQAKPEKHFYLCSIKASDLKALTGVYRRSTKGGTARAKDPNVQRGHEEERSRLIREFVQHGFPWCEMSESKRRAEGATDLKKPGWLPTAILVNVLRPKEERNGVRIPDSDLVRIDVNGETAVLNFPKKFSNCAWEPEKVFPLEVIDGQHRLWAFEDFNPGDDFEVPVVAFHGLDRGWQAYLFWSVNITPKKINRSLAFDLYPLLRQQTWLDKFFGHPIYRETRCQELVEALWSHPDSPWYQRINMLGEKRADRDYKGPAVTQAAWIRSLFASFVKQWEGTGTRIGGLFGPPPRENDPLLPWSRPMQAAVLIFAGNTFKKQIKETSATWARHLRALDGGDLFKTDDPAFYGQFSLVSTDQGIRGFLFVINDLCFVKSEALDLSGWRWDLVSTEMKRTNQSATDEAAVSAAVKSFAKTKAAKFIDDIATGLASYDWRTSSTPDLNRDEQLRQSVFRGSGGYKELRQQLLVHLASKKPSLKRECKSIMNALGYE